MTAISQVADVEDAETHFQAHEFLDVTVQPKAIYITPNEVYSMHSLLTQYADSIVSLHSQTISQKFTSLSRCYNATIRSGPY